MSSNKPGYQSEYIRKHYRENKEYYLAAAKERKRNTLIAIREYKRAKGCSRCVETDPRCLDFHHLDSKTKEFSISNAFRMGYSLERIFLEIEKCILLCANCHRKESLKDLVV
jgi:hypothetical protein